jgi:putative membrane protein
MLNKIARFILRWLIASLGLLITVRFLNQNFNVVSHLGELILAGFLLAIINIVLKPILIILSLPAIMISLGLFMIIINGLLIYLVCRFFPGLEIKDFTSAIFAGMVIGLLNYLVSTFLDERQK